MERKSAEFLYSEFLKHPYIFSPTTRFVDALESVEISESSRFYEEIPNVQQVCMDCSSEYTLSLRRIIRNKNAVLSKVSGLKSVWRDVVSKIGMYDSDVILRDLREDNEIIEIMSSSLKGEYEFSLFGKLDSLDSVSEKYSSRPVLVIPGMMFGENLKKIVSWEEANTVRK